VDQAEASRHAKAGLAAFDEQDWATMQREFGAAIEYADPLHWALESYHSHFALALYQLGRHDEADEASRGAIRVAVAQAGRFDSIATLNLHFLANNLNSRSKFEDALKEIRASDFKGNDFECWVWFSVACAHWGLGALDESNAALRQAESTATKDEHRVRVREQFEKWKKSPKS
jgi:tetratricopeptide (TPR) repeat protein